LNINQPMTVLKTLQKLRADVFAEGEATFAEWRPSIKRRSFLLSSPNFAYYLAFRHHDLRELQAELIPLGLSSLGRSEGHVLENLDAVIASLTAICKQPTVDRPSVKAFHRGGRQLDRNTNIVLGAPPLHRRVRIMVTLPTEAATDPALVADLVKRCRGMDADDRSHTAGGTSRRSALRHPDGSGWTEGAYRRHRCTAPCQFVIQRRSTAADRSRTD